MSETENPVDTVVRLLSKNIRVIKEDGTPASIRVSREWINQELLKNVDGQITVGLAESRDTKIDMSGKLRRHVSSLRVNIWSQDTLTRQRMVEEVNHIIHQNNKKPNETLYNFAGVGQTSGTHKSYAACALNELSPEDAGWSEFADTDYQKIWYSDDTRYSRSCSLDGECALMLFRFKIDIKKSLIKKIVLAFEGYGSAPNGNGVTIKVWNQTASEWQNAQTGIEGEDQTITITLTSNIVDFVDDAGHIWLLAKTTHPSNGETPTILYCDCVSCTVTVNGISYLDIVSFHDADRADVKPIIYRTEFTLKSWFIENIASAS
jgi:hypothetical protein